MAKYNFDESFLSALQFTRKLNEERDMFTQNMAAQTRQFDLLQGLRQKDFEAERTEADRTYNMDKVLNEDKIRKDYEKVPSWSQGGQSGAELNKGFGGVMKPFDMSGFYQEKTATKPLVDMYEDMGVVDYEGSPHNMKRNKSTGKMEYFPAWREPKTGGGAGGGGGKAPGSFSEDPLKEWQVQQGLNYLQNPEFAKEVKEGNEVKTVNLSVDELKQNLDDSINNLGSAYLDSETFRWLSEQKTQYGRYPSPEELQNEIVQSGKAQELTPEQGERLNSFLNLYYQSYGGINKVQRRIINPKSFELE